MLPNHGRSIGESPPPPDIKLALLTHPCVGRVEVAFDGTFPSYHRTGDRNRCQFDKICGSSMIGAGRRALVPPFGGYYSPSCNDE